MRSDRRHALIAAALLASAPASPPTVPAPRNQSRYDAADRAYHGNRKQRRAEEARARKVTRKSQRR